MYVYKNLFIVERKKNNALTQRILNRYKVTWGILEPFTYSSGEDLLILSFTTNVYMSEIVDSNCRYELVCNMKLLCSKKIFKVKEFNTNLREFVRFTMTTVKIMLCKLYKNPYLIWPKNIEPFIILEAHKKGLLYNFREHIDMIKKRHVVPNIVWSKLTTKVIEKSRHPPVRYLTWDRLVYVKQ